MSDMDVIIKSIRRVRDKNDKAYKVTEYYIELTKGSLDDGGIALVRCKLLSIEKELLAWIKKHPNNESTIMSPEESAIILINDLKNRKILE